MSRADADAGADQSINQTVTCFLFLCLLPCFAWKLYVVGIELKAERCSPYTWRVDMDGRSRTLRWRGARREIGAPPPTVLLSPPRPPLRDLFRSSVFLSFSTCTFIDSFNLFLVGVLEFNLCAAFVIRWFFDSGVLFKLILMRWLFLCSADKHFWSLCTTYLAVLISCLTV